MRCPHCSTPAVPVLDTKVVDSRLNLIGDLTRRRRECMHCGGRFTTYERIEEILPAVIKRDGRREAFNHEKLFIGIQKACEKRPITTQHIEGMVQDIEKRLSVYENKEISSETIGTWVMILLHRLDKVAYVRFASVYRKFQDVNEFVAELKDPPPSELWQPIPPEKLDRPDRPELVKKMEGVPL